MSDRANVDQCLGAVEGVDEITFLGRDKIQALREHTGDVRVALEAVAFDQGKDPFHLSLVVDVLGENVFIEWISGGAVDEHQSRFTMDTGKFAEEFPAFFALDPVAGFEHLAGPEDGPFGSGVESLGIEQGTLIVVAQQANSTPPHAIDALTGIGAVANDVAQAIDLFDRLGIDVFEHGLEGFEVAVDIADEGSTHRGHSTGLDPSGTSVHDRCSRNRAKPRV